MVVRKELTIALRDLLQHGLMEVNALTSAAYTLPLKLLAD